jgi:hypothetical protein
MNQEKGKNTMTKQMELGGTFTLLVLLCYKQSQAPSVTKRAGGELLNKMSGNLNS